MFFVYLDVLDFFDNNQLRNKARINFILKYLIFQYEIKATYLRLLLENQANPKQVVFSLS